MLRSTLRRLGKSAPKKLKVGDQVPEDVQCFVGVPPSPADTNTLLDGKTVVLLCVPGAFTGTCSKQLPMLAEKADELKAHFGASELYCVATNDSFVMDGWAKSLGIDSGNMKMLADPNQNLMKALGLTVTLPVLGGARFSRACCVIEDRKITHLFEEPDAKKLTCTTPAEMIKGTKASAKPKAAPAKEA